MPNTPNTILDDMPADDEAALKKQQVITLLADHWEEWLFVLRQRKLMQSGCTLPDELYELAQLLSEFIYHSEYSRCGEPENGTLTADEKGLLEKAKFFISHKTETDSHTNDAIVSKDGLFFVGNKTETSDIDPLFQSLVDSVL